MNKHCWTAVLLIGIATCAQAQPEGQAALRTRSLAAACAACHGTDGHAVDTAGVPGLAGKRRDDLAAQLRDFRSGARSSTVMGQLSKGLNDAQIDLLADYFSTVKDQ